MPATLHLEANYNMFKTEKINLKTSGTLNPLVQDYLDKKESLKPFYDHYPDEKGFASLLKTNPYSDLNRDKLSEITLDRKSVV